MKASTLIANLQAEIEQHGDLPVFYTLMGVPTPGSYGDHDISDVSAYDNESKCNNNNQKTYITLI